MRQAKILFKNEEAGLLIQHDDGSFTFHYHAIWMANNNYNGISLTLPKTKQDYHSKTLFPFFYNLLPEGSNKQVICKSNKIDKDDFFGILLATAVFDSIGAITVIEIE